MEIHYIIKGLLGIAKKVSDISRAEISAKFGINSFCDIDGFKTKPKLVNIIKASRKI